MRIAALIIGFVTALVLAIQAWMANTSGDLGPDEVTSTAAGAGIMMAMTWVLASALVIPSPLASTVLFSVTAVVGLIVTTGEFGELRYYGIVAIGLAVMAFVGWRKKLHIDEELAIEGVRQYQHRRIASSKSRK